MSEHIGEIFALLTACCWAVTAMSFEISGKRIGSLAVNFIRLVIGFGFLCVFSYLYRGMILPFDATAHNWLWLSISGLIGFSFGDLMLFRAFVVIGSRVSMLIMSLVPVFAAISGWLLMREHLSLMDLFGMTLTIVGIAIVITQKESSDSHFKQPIRRRKYPVSGILFAVAGALGQAIGLVFSKYGMGDYDAYSATQIRAIAGIAGFAILYIPLRAWPKVIKGVKNRSAMKIVILGSFFGPFLGVSFSLLSVRYTATGIASTIMSIVPILIIPPAVVFFHEKVTLKEVLGAFVSVAGVSILFI